MQGFLNGFLKKILAWGLIHWYLVNLYILYHNFTMHIYEREKRDCRDLEHHGANLNKLSRFAPFPHTHDWKSG